MRKNPNFSANISQLSCRNPINSLINPVKLSPLLLKQSIVIMQWMQKCHLKEISFSLLKDIRPHENNNKWKMKVDERMEKYHPTKHMYCS